MKKSKEEYPEMLGDKQALKGWVKRKLKDKLTGKKYEFKPRDFDDIARGVRYGNHMAIQLYQKKWYKKFLNYMFGPVEKPKIQSRVIPLHAKVDNSKKNAIIPYQLVDDFIESASYRIIVNECICRKGMQCKDYPIDMGCIMLGEGCRVMVENGNAREVTAEEAKTYARKGAEAGLVVFAAQAKAEEQLMGIPKDKYAQFIELCFCCPCCCVAMKNLPYYTPEIKKHNFVSVGFVAKALPECTGCKKCIKVCAAKAIRVNGNKVWVKEDECIGCGLCQEKCEHDAIQLVQIGKAKGNLVKYFDGYINLDITRKN